MSEGPLPKTWEEAWPLVTWGVLIFTAGFEGISHLIVGEFVSAGIAFAIMVALMAALLHWRQIRAWIGSTNPNLVFVATALALFAIIVSPFIEQHRWPFSSPITAPSIYASNNLSLAAPPHSSFFMRMRTARGAL